MPPRTRRGGIVLHRFLPAINRLQIVIYNCEQVCFNARAMSAGDGREGKIRAGMQKGQLGGKLAGLSLPRQIISIAQWPLLEQILSFVCATTSLYLATHLGSDGEDTAQIASGIGVTGFVMWLGFLMQGAVGMGATAIVSRMTGARKFGEANYAANQSATLGILSGILSAWVMYSTAGFLVSHVLKLSIPAQKVALEYMDIASWVAVFSGFVFAVNAALRGAGDTRTPFLIMLAVDGLNIIFSLILVKCCGMFIDGLAWGMMLGMISAAAILAGVLYFRGATMKQAMGSNSIDSYAAARGKSYVPPLFFQARALIPNYSEMWRILVIGLPQAAEIGGIWIIQIYVLSVISSLGDAYVGAHNIAIRIESLSFLPGFAIGLAGATLLGQYLGSGSARMALATVRKCMLYAVLFMGSMGIVFFLFPHVFVNIFANKSAELMQATLPVVQIFLVIEPFYAAMLIIKMCLRGAGYTKKVMMVSYGCMGFFRVGCLMAWNFFWPQTLSLVGIWGLIAVDLAVEYIILNNMLYGLKWVRKKV